MAYIMLASDLFNRFNTIWCYGISLLLAGGIANAATIGFSESQFIASQYACVGVVGGDACSQQDGFYYSTRGATAAKLLPLPAEIDKSGSEGPGYYFSDAASSSGGGSYSLPSGSSGGTISAAGGTIFVASQVCIQPDSECPFPVYADASSGASFETDITVNSRTYYSLTFTGNGGISEGSTSSENNLIYWEGDFSNLTSYEKTGYLDPGTYFLFGNSGGDANTCVGCIASGTSDFFLTVTLSPEPIPKRAATPKMSLPGGQYSSAKKLEISSETSGAKIYYTTDGSIPTSKSTTYTGPIEIAQSEHINAIAVADGYTESGGIGQSYVIESATAKPSFTPKGGAFKQPQSVVLADTTPSATIYYTTDGSTPTENSAIYLAPIEVTVAETIKAIAVGQDDSPSAVVSQTYTIE